MRRLCHHHSDYINQSSGNAYWSSPRANISLNGKFAVFTSNWGSTTRRDVFVLQIPAMNTTAIDDNKQTALTLFPNPAKDYLQVKIPKSLQLSSLEITDLFGRLVFGKKNISSVEDILISELQSGTYFLRAGSAAQKFMIAR